MKKSRLLLKQFVISRQNFCSPFQFILADAAAAKTIEGLLLLEALAVGGMLVMDDFTPEEHFPGEWGGKPDKVRDFWLNQKELRATKIY